MTVGTEPAAAFELSRPAPTGVKVAFAALFALSLATVPGAVLLTVAVCSPGGNGFLWLHELTSGSPFGLAPWVGTAIALLAVSLVLDKLWQARARHRWGRCRLDDDELVFEPCLGGGEERVLLDDVTGFTVTPHGVIVDLPDRAPSLRWSRPLLIPAREGEEQARVLSRLEAPREHGPGEASFGRARPAWVRLALGVALLALSTPALALVGLRYGQLALTLVAAPVVFLQLPGLLLFERRVLGPRWTPLHLGRRALWTPEQRIGWEQVTRVAWSETAVIVEAGETRLHAHVAPRLEQARRLLARRLAGRGSRLDPTGPVPAWAGSQALKRRALAVTALVLATPLLATGLALSDLPIHDTIEVQDFEGVELTLVHRVSDDAPRRLRIVDRERGVAVDADLSWSTPLFTAAIRKAHQRILATPATPPALADLLDEQIPVPVDPGLRDWLEGRQGRRTFRARDREGWELIWGAEAGKVLLCALVHPGSGVAADLWLEGGSLQLTSLTDPANVTSHDEALPLIRVDGPGAVLAFPGPLPELEELLRATRAIRSGATIAEVSRELRELQEAR